MACYFSTSKNEGYLFWIFILFFPTFSIFSQQEYQMLDGHIESYLLFYIQTKMKVQMLRQNSDRYSIISQSISRSLLLQKCRLEMNIFKQCSTLSKF